MAGLAFSVHKAAGCSVAAAGGSGGGCRDRGLFALGRRRRRGRSHCLRVMIVRRRRGSLLFGCNRGCGGEKGGGGAGWGRWGLVRPMARWGGGGWGLCALAR